MSNPLFVAIDTPSLDRARQIAGAVLGGTLGQVVSLGSQFGFGTAFLRFSREYERQADLLGAQIMARAGYNPRDMASMFETIQARSGNGGPEWLSSHPNPSNRQQTIAQEAAKRGKTSSAATARFRSDRDDYATLARATRDQGALPFGVLDQLMPCASGGCGI